MDMSDVMGPGEIAHRLGVSVDTARRMIQRKQLDGGYTFKHWWATKKSVEKWAKTHPKEK